MSKNKKSSNYLKQLMNIAKNIDRDPGVHFVSVSHDKWCDKLKNSKESCNCNPDVAQQVKE